MVAYDTSNRRAKPGSSSYCAIMFPCACGEEEQDKYECKETSSRLLADFSVNDKDNGHLSPRNESGDQSDPPTDGGALTPVEAGMILRTAPTPSAPVLYPQVEEKGQHFYDRSDSLPVQASS